MMKALLMLGLLSHLCYPAIVAQEPSKAWRPAGADLIGALLVRLELPAEGRYVAEGRIVNFAIGDEDRAKSLAYLRELATEFGWSAQTSEGRSLLWSKRHRTGSAWMPPVIGWMSWDATVYCRSQELSVASGRQVIVSRMWHENADGEPVHLPGYIQMTKRFRQGGEVISWSIDTDGGRTVTTRHKLDPASMGTEGDWYKFVTSASSVRKILDLARSADEFEESADSIRWRVDLSKAEQELYVIEKHDLDLSCWIYQLPCQGTYEFLGSPRDGYVLTVEWVDSAGGPLAYERMEWQPDAPLPTSWREVCYIPGTERPCALRDYRFAPLAPLPPDAEPIGWSPEPGEDVLDSRFGAPVSYVVGSDGSLPSDEWIAAKAASYAQRQELPVSAEPVRGRIQFDPDADQRARTIELELGAHLVGTAAPFEVEISNASDRKLRLGPVMADCGCTGTSLIVTELRPGGSANFRAFQNIEQAGEQRSRIVIGTDGGDGAELVIGLSFRGELR